MEPSMPTAEAVAVREGRIVEVGTLETLRPWLDRYDHEIDDTYADHVIMPGLIDPHLHPSMAAILLPMEFTTAVEWQLPWEHVGAIRSRVEFLDRLVALDARLEPDQPLIAWGHHPIWHGDVDREQLNGISSTRPIIVWHRGYHSFIVNDACYRWMDLDLDAARRHPQIDVERGAFFETGLSVRATGYHATASSWAPSASGRGSNGCARSSTTAARPPSAMQRIGHVRLRTRSGITSKAVMERPRHTRSGSSSHRSRWVRRCEARPPIRTMVERVLSLPRNATPTGCASATTSRCSPTAASSPSCSMLEVPPSSGHLADWPSR